MKIQIKKLNKNAIIPTKGTPCSAGMDLYACIEEKKIIPPGCSARITTGLCIAIPKDYAGFIYARSGLADKQGLRPSNCVGVGDSDYRGEYIVALYNDSNEERVVSYGDRIAQLIVAPVVDVEWTVVDSLDDTQRGSAGFGSTGV